MCIFHTYLVPPSVASLVVKMVKRLPAMQKTQVRSLGWEDPLGKEMATHSSTLPGKFHGRRSVVGYSSWDCKELGTTEQLHFLCLNVWNSIQSQAQWNVWIFKRSLSVGCVKTINSLMSVQAKFAASKFSSGLLTWVNFNFLKIWSFLNFFLWDVL